MRASSIITLGSLAMLAACGDVGPGGANPDVPAVPGTATIERVERAWEGPRAVVDGRPQRALISGPIDEIARAGDLTVKGGFLHPPVTRDVRVHFRVAHSGSQPDRLIAVSSSAATTASMMALSREKGEVEVAYLEFGPNDLREGATPEEFYEHMQRSILRIRLSGFRMPQNPSNGIPVTLTFERAGRFTVHAFPLVEQP